jgi:DNA-binding GntR family transcriptional regulator
LPGKLMNCVQVCIQDDIVTIDFGAVNRIHASRSFPPMPLADAAKTPDDAKAPLESEGRVEALYASLKAMAVDFRLRPGERLNEGALARALNASRTPLREALNRLVAEQLIDFQPGKGFFCRALDPQSIFNLYELRVILETASLRLAVTRGSDAAIIDLHAALYSEGLQVEGRTIREMTALDEAFHLGIARLGGNEEIVRQLERLNERIRFIRWIDMSSNTGRTKGEHRAIMAAIEARDVDGAVAIMQLHIAKRMDQIVAAVREGYSNIYVSGSDTLSERSAPAGSNRND